MHVHARAHRYVPVHITLLTSWPPDIMPAWRQSLWQLVSAHAREGKEEWEVHWTHRHLSKQRKKKKEVLQRMKDLRGGGGECIHLLGLVSSLLVWAAFSRHVWNISRLYEARTRWVF